MTILTETELQGIHGGEFQPLNQPAPTYQPPPAVSPTLAQWFAEQTRRAEQQLLATNN